MDATAGETFSPFQLVQDARIFTCRRPQHPLAHHFLDSKLMGPYGGPTLVEVRLHCFITEIVDKIVRLKVLEPCR